jgi:hypothetical protein
MNNGIEELRDMVGALLAKRLPTPEMIRDQINHVRKLYTEVTDKEAEKLALEFEHIHGVTMDIGSTLEAPGFEKWLDDSRSQIDFYYWDRYHQQLGERGFSGHVLATLDNVTDRTLGLLDNPRKEGRWDRRGMVVGHVQSGKTANYTGLICKAADAGYEVIIVIAGIHNNLRSQTQARIDDGFIGFDSSKLRMNRPGAESIIGVGRHNSSRRPNAFTNTLSDFNKQTATSIGIPLENLKEPVVFVIKKNTSTLKNLLEWLKEHNAKRGKSSIDAPMLLIDDEADNASINISKGQDETSRINGQIRQLLDVFDRSCYVGYTATPFANIFIDPDSDNEKFGADLFPRDFIVSLDPPNNYFGASRIFLPDEEKGDVDSVVRHIEDNEELLPLKHKKDHAIVELPESLQSAMRAFVVARAIRLVRGHVGVHNSMLVNSSRFIEVQRQLRNEIHARINTMKANIRVNGFKSEAEALRDPEIYALKRVFDQEYAKCKVTWGEALPYLWESVSAINVIEVNSKSSDSLDYDAYKNGFNVIAVGGFSLSRGLTLEGLMVSYFLRNSIMYDTLMQMGRWFGYRPGYEDLCRIWMPEEAEGWYAHVAESTEELREELRQMEVRGATPSEFGLKVRSHPDNLIVTARNKMGTAEEVRVSIGLSNRFIETATVPYRLQASNRDAVRQFADCLSVNKKIIDQVEDLGNGYLLKDIDVDHVINFLDSYINAGGSAITDTGPLKRYISDRASSELSFWNIYIPSNSSPDYSPPLATNIFGVEVICQRRKIGKHSNDVETRITDNQRVASPSQERVDLDPELVQRAKETYLKDNPSKRTVPGAVYRTLRKKPLLILHLLAMGDKDDDFSKHEPTVAWSISFPESHISGGTVEYIVNTTWFRDRYLQEESEDDAGGDDD